jgi:hypothetical protein
MKTTPQVWLSEPDEAGQIWQERFYDFNVWTEKKQIEKLRYIHRNPVERRVGRGARSVRWSSFRSYAYREPGLVRINSRSGRCRSKGLGGAHSRSHRAPGPFAKSAKGQGTPRFSLVTSLDQG